MRVDREEAGEAVELFRGGDRETAEHDAAMFENKRIQQVAALTAPAEETLEIGQGAVMMDEQRRRARLGKGGRCARAKPVDPDIDAIGAGGEITWRRMVVLHAASIPVLQWRGKPSAIPRIRKFQLSLAATSFAISASRATAAWWISGEVASTPKARGSCLL